MFGNINLYTPNIVFIVRTHQFGCTDSIGCQLQCVVSKVYVFALITGQRFIAKNIWNACVVVSPILLQISQGFWKENSPNRVAN